MAENLPIGGHNSPAFISPYLYKFRLISHAYAEVGLGVIKTLLRDDKYRRYRVLHLPYKDFALSKTTQTLQSLDVPAFVDTIEIQPFSVPACDITELEEERNHEIECATYGGWSEDEPDPLGQLQEERWIFLRQSGQQDQFLETVTSPEGTEDSRCDSHHSSQASSTQRQGLRILEKIYPDRPSKET